MHSVLILYLQIFGSFLLYVNDKNQFHSYFQMSKHLHQGNDLQPSFTGSILDRCNLLTAV